MGTTLLTGATGNVGRTLAQKLVGAGIPGAPSGRSCAIQGTPGKLWGPKRSS